MIGTFRKTQGCVRHEICCITGIMRIKFVAPLPPMSQKSKKRKTR